MKANRLRPLALLLACALVQVPVTGQGETVERGTSPVDKFHPAVLRGDEIPEETFGGRMIVHLPSLPGSMNRVIENSSVVREMWYDLHESLLHQDWENWGVEPAAVHPLGHRGHARPEAGRADRVRGRRPDDRVD